MSLIRLPAPAYGAFRLLASGSTLFLLYTTLVFLIEPRPDEAARIYDFGVLIGFEFILNPLNMLLAMFSGTRTGKLAVLVFFSGFIFAFRSLMIDPMAMNMIIASLLFGHFVNFTRQQDAQADSIVGAFAGRTMWYFLVLMACAFGQSLLPELGLDDAWKQAARYEDIRKHGGILLEMPHVSAWIGVFYYGGLLFAQVLALATKIPALDRLLLGVSTAAAAWSARMDASASRRRRRRPR